MPRRPHDGNRKSGAARHRPVHGPEMLSPVYFHSFTFPDCSMPEFTGVGDPENCTEHQWLHPADTPPGKQRQADPGAQLGEVTGGAVDVVEGNDLRVPNAT